MVEEGGHIYDVMSVVDKHGHEFKLFFDITIQMSKGMQDFD